MPKPSPQPVSSARAALVAALLLANFTASADDVGPGGTVRVEPAAPTQAAPDPDPWTPFQASVYPPVQVVDSGRAVRGLRLNLPYGRQTRVSGLDLGLSNQVTTALRGLQVGLANGSEGTTRGLQMGFANWSRKGFSGAQLGFANLADEGPVRGLQLGFANTAGGLSGLQLGFVNLNSGEARAAQLGLINTSGTTRGLQVGFVNAADRLRGLQLGLVNVNREGGPLRFFPVLNVGW